MPYSSFQDHDGGGWISFADKAKTFLQKTQEHVLQGINPGGIYQAIWCRDAAYILRDWFLSGNIDGTMQQIYQIWSHQISPNNPEKLVYGRGSPEMKFLSEVVNEDKQKSFKELFLQRYIRLVFQKYMGKIRILILQH
jgi:hypothetical protein